MTGNNNIRIVTPKSDPMAPAMTVYGTQIFVNDEEVNNCRKAVLTMEAGNVVRLSLETYPSSVVEWNGEGFIETMPVCPACKAAMQDSATVMHVVKVAAFGEAWYRNLLIAKESNLKGLMTPSEEGPGFLAMSRYLRIRMGMNEESAALVWVGLDDHERASWVAAATPFEGK